MHNYLDPQQAIFRLLALSFRVDFSSLVEDPHRHSFGLCLIRNSQCSPLRELKLATSWMASSSLSLGMTPQPLEKHQIPK